MNSCKVNLHFLALMLCAPFLLFSLKKIYFFFFCPFCLFDYRTDGVFQAYSLGESSHTSMHDMHAGYGHLPHFSQNFPSRFGQQSVHRYSHMNSTFMHSERNHQNSQPTHSNYSMADSHSSTDAMFSNGTPWGNLHNQVILFNSRHTFK